MPVPDSDGSLNFRALQRNLIQATIVGLTYLAISLTITTFWQNDAFKLVTIIFGGIIAVSFVGSFVIAEKKTLSRKGFWPAVVCLGSIVVFWLFIIIGFFATGEWKLSVIKID